MPIRVTVNGRERDCESPNLADLWRAEASELEIPDSRGFAIALNGAVVPKQQWPTKTLTAGDRVEIIRAMQGG